MREWILENTDITAKKYDSLINPDMIHTTGTKITEKPYIEADLFSNPIIVIDEFTREKPNNYTKSKYKVISKKDYYIHQNVKFYILAELINDMRETLYSSDRIGRCIELSIEIAKKLKDCHIATAICINPFNKLYDTFLHTFIIFTKNNEEYVIDATLNAVIRKKTYLSLHKAKIISDIPKDIAISNLDIIDELSTLHISQAEYLCFPTQVMNAVKKFTRTKI